MLQILVRMEVFVWIRSMDTHVNVLMASKVSIANEVNLIIHVISYFKSYFDILNSGCSAMMDIVYVIDSSGSIRRERFPFVLDWVNTMVADLNVASSKQRINHLLLFMLFICCFIIIVSTRVGAIRYSDEANVEFHLKDYHSRQDVISAVNDIGFIGGRTHTSAALVLLVSTSFKEVDKSSSCGLNNCLCVILQIRKMHSAQKMAVERML